MMARLQVSTGSFLYALRNLRQHPLRTVAIVLTFGLALGLNSALFSLVNAVLIRPLPFAHAERLVMIWTELPSQGIREGTLSEPEYLDLEESRIFERLAVLTIARVNLTRDGEPQQIQAGFTSAGLLAALGVTPALGRDFMPKEDLPGAPGTVLLSYGFWQRRFGSDPTRIGHTLTLNGKPYTIIGVAPPDLRLLEDVEIWLPLGIDNANPNGRGGHYLKGIGALPRGRSLRQAQSELATLSTRLLRSYPRFYPQTSGWRLRMIPVREQQVGQIRPALLILLAAGGLVLLIACANIANLWLTDVWGRRRDFAVQVAFGASRLHILRQLLVNGLLLGVLGGLLGLLLAHGVLRLFLLAAPPVSPQLRDVSFDLNVFAFTLGLAFLVGLAAGLVPALQASKGVSRTLREMVGRASQSVRSRWVRGLLVVAEIALALIVIVGAGLLLKNLSNLYRNPTGFAAKGLLTVSLSLPPSKYQEESRIVAFYDELIRQARALPGVDRASAVFPLPLSGRSTSGDFSVEGFPYDEANGAFEASRFAVGPGYFETMSIPVLRGRAFNEQDRATSPGVVIIDDTLTRRLWPRGDPIGKRLKRGKPDSKEPWLTIVGVAARIKSTSVDAEEKPQMYFPYGQFPLAEMSLVLRSPAGDPARLAEGVRSLILRIDPDQPVSTIRTMEEWLSTSLSRQRFAALLLSAFALVGLVLATLGIYAVVSSFVTERWYEVGIRMALGACPEDAIRLFFRQSFTLGLTGIAAGLGGAFLMAPLLASQLYHLSPLDPWVYLAASGLLLSVAFLATYVPARRIVRQDPAIALRHV
jgi:predicted permease